MGVRVCLVPRAFRVAATVICLFALYKLRPATPFRPTSLRPPPTARPADSRPQEWRTFANVALANAPFAFQGHGTAS